ncbi:MAG: serine O-acetyltransferase EpsC [Cyanobacteriota bacterium]|nr:serine O-acetyltransferase EpsC [Cyanobacteriota bacterium]
MTGVEGFREPAAQQGDGRSRELPLEAIVRALRAQRDVSSHPWQSQQLLRLLPSAKALRQVMAKLSAALYPHRLGRVETGSTVVTFETSSIDFFVGHTLAVALMELREQIALELALPADPGERNGSRADRDDRAARMIVDFAECLPGLRMRLDRDLEAAFRGDPAASSLEEVLVCYPGMKAIIGHRFAHELHRLGAPMVARILSELCHSETGVDIHPGAVIGDHFFIDHGTGVVIGGTARIGDNVRVYQAVTLGAKSFPVDAKGYVVKGEPRHPIIEDDVVIYSGATLLGRITIGRGSTIGGNVWLTRSVPPGSVITQAQARYEKFVDGAGI